MGVLDPPSLPFDLAEHERRCQATYDARDAAWAACGEVDPYVLAPIINSAFTGGAVWPNLRQSYKTIHGPLGIYLASDGLSDPFDDSWADPPEQSGFAMEVYAIADRLPDVAPLSSWLLPIVTGFASQVAKHGGVHRLLDELGTISTELYDVPIPDALRARFVNAEGRVGVLVGLDAPPVPRGVSAPAGPIRLANLKLLYLSELAFILARGEAGRVELTERFSATPTPLVSSLEREPVA